MNEDVLYVECWNVGRNSAIVPGTELIVRFTLF